MSKLRNNFKVAELHRVAQFAKDLAEKYHFVEQQFVIVLAALTSFLTRLIKAIKREEAISDLEEKDHLRDIAFRSFYYFLKSYSTFDVDIDKDIYAAGQKCFAIIAKYSSIARENYYISTTYVDSLLNDFAVQTNADALAKIPGSAAFLTALTNRQSSFKEAQLKFVQGRNSGETPSSLKRPVLRFMNLVFIPTVAACAELDPDTYGQFARELEDYIAQANAMAKARIKDDDKEGDESDPKDDTVSPTDEPLKPGNGESTGSEGTGTGSEGTGNKPGGQDDDSMPAA